MFLARVVASSVNVVASSLLRPSRPYVDLVIVASSLLRISMSPTAFVLRLRLQVTCGSRDKLATSPRDPATGLEARRAAARQVVQDCPRARPHVAQGAPPAVDATEVRSLFHTAPRWGGGTPSGGCEESRTRSRGRRGARLSQ